jgi:hypothetical protein
MLVRPTPLVIPPRASATIQIDNSRFSLTKQQISEIAHIFDPAAKDELAKARTAWIKYQSTRKRDAIYGFLSAVFEIVSRWKKQNRAKSSSRRALNATKRNGAIRTNEPFASLFGARRIRIEWMQRLGASGHGRFDMPGDLSQIIKAWPSSLKAGAASTNVPPGGLVG